MPPLPRLVAIVCLTLLAACGGSSGSSTTDDAPDPQALLSDAADATAGLKTFHFELEHENGSLELPFGLELVRARGDFAVPDRLKADVRAERGDLNFDLQVISVGGRTWISNPFSRRLEELPDTNIQEIIDPLALIQVVTEEIDNPEVTGSEEQGGVDCWRLTGSMDRSALASVLDVGEGDPIDFEMWLGKEDALPRQVRLKGALTPSDEDTTVRRIDFSRFNETVDITAPR